MNVGFHGQRKTGVPEEKGNVAALIRSQVFGLQPF